MTSTLLSVFLVASVCTTRASQDPPAKRRRATRPDPVGTGTSPLTPTQAVMRNPDLLGLVMGNFGYTERLGLRSVCQDWKNVEATIAPPLAGQKLFDVIDLNHHLILERTSSIEFQGSRFVSGQKFFGSRAFFLLKQLMHNSVTEDLQLDANRLKRFWESNEKVCIHCPDGDYPIMEIALESSTTHLKFVVELFSRSDNPEERKDEREFYHVLGVEGSLSGSHRGCITMTADLEKFITSVKNACFPEEIPGSGCTWQYSAKIGPSKPRSTKFLTVIHKNDQWDGSQDQPVECTTQ